MLRVYMRCSSSRQTLKVQREQLRRAVEARGQAWADTPRYEDEARSGRNAKRPELQRMLEAMQKGDVIITPALDRLTRSLRDLGELVDAFERRGVTLRSLRENLDLATATGRAMVAMVGVFAAMESDLIRERTLAAMAYLKSKGRKLGPAKVIDDDAIIELKRSEPELTVRQIAGRLAISKSTVAAVLSADRTTATAHS